MLRGMLPLLMSSLILETACNPIHGNQHQALGNPRQAGKVSTNAILEFFDPPESHGAVSTGGYNGDAANCMSNVSVNTLLVSRLKGHHNEWGGF